MSEEEMWGEDNSGHDCDCDCKACLIDTWHAEVQQERALVRRYRRGLQTIVASAKWCPDYAMCDHVGCESAHRAAMVALSALDIEQA